MPYKPKKPCSYPGCPELTYERFCEKHKQQAAREYNRYGRDGGSKCDYLVTKEQIEQYAASVARYIQCEEGISAFGLLAKHLTTNVPIASPYVGMSERFLKRANDLWARIYQVVKENCEVPVGKNHKTAATRFNINLSALQNEN